MEELHAVSARYSVKLSEMFSNRRLNVYFNVLILLRSSVLQFIRNYTKYRDSVVLHNLN